MCEEMQVAEVVEEEEEEEEDEDEEDGDIFYNIIRLY
jgi:hypothetical protein